MNNKKGNIFREWLYAHDNLSYTTPSPYPDLEYYRAEKELPVYKNFPFTLKYKRYYWSNVFNYFKEQAAIIIHNNPTYSESQVYTSVRARVLMWIGNEELLEKEESVKILHSAIKDAFQSRDKLQYKPYRYTKHFYSSRIEKLPGHPYGTKWEKDGRAVTKLRLRNEYYGQLVTDTIQQAVLEYKKQHYDVLPTAQYLADHTPFSLTTIKRHGNGFYIGKKENTLQLIEKVLLMYPDKTLKEVATQTGIPYWSLKRYSKQVKGILKVQ